MKLIFIMSLCVLIFSCSSNSNHQRIGLEKGYELYKKQHQYIVEQLNKKYFQFKKQWPKLYATFGNIDYFFGEELKIEGVFIGRVLFDGKHSETIAVNHLGVPFNEKDHPSVYRGNLGDFDQTMDFTSSLYDINTPMLIEINFLVRTKTKQLKVVKEKFLASMKCQSTICKFKTVKEARLALSNKTMTGVDFKSYQKYKHNTVSVSLDDPLQKWRSDKVNLAKAYRRLVWIGMPERLLELYSINRNYGSFSCLISKNCRSGYRNIQIKDSIVINYELDIQNRKVVE